jgi:hypothetical protein
MIEVTKYSSVQIGNCNGCNRHAISTGTEPHEVWQISLRSCAVRVCAKCRAELIKAIWPEGVASVKEINDMLGHEHWVK